MSDPESHRLLPKCLQRSRSIMDLLDRKKVRCGNRRARERRDCGITTHSESFLTVEDEANMYANSKAWNLFLP